MMDLKSGDLLSFFFYLQRQFVIQSWALFLFIRMKSSYSFPLTLLLLGDVAVELNGLL